MPDETTLVRFHQRLHEKEMLLALIKPQLQVQGLFLNLHAMDVTLLQAARRVPAKTAPL